MTSRDNFISAGTAALLAVLFPFYWITFLGQTFDGFEAALKQDLLTFNWRDLLFVLIGALEVCVYLSLSNHLKSHFNARSARILLCAMAAVVAIFHSTVLFDIYLALTNQDMLSESTGILAMVVAFGSLGVYTLFAAVFSIVCLINKHLPPLLKVFSVLMLLMSILQMTLVLSFTNVFLFPAALLVLSIYFVKDKEELEVI